MQSFCVQLVRHQDCEEIYLFIYLSIHQSTSTYKNKYKVKKQVKELCGLNG